MAEYPDIIRKKNASDRSRYLLAALAVLLFLGALLVHSRTVQAAVSYEIRISDDADLLSADEEAELYTSMEPITKYGNAMFMSTNDSLGSDPEGNAEAAYETAFGSTDGMIFFIDMNNRVLTLYSRGSVYHVITKGYARTITDNVYSYASDGDYLACAQEAFAEADTLLEGGRISQPMRLITNVLLAFIFAFLAAFLILTVQRSRLTAYGRDTASADRNWRGVRVNRGDIIRRHTYVISSDSSGSGGSGGGSSGGGGGGGGSHGF